MSKFNKDRYDLQCRNLIDALARSIVDATDEEIEEDARQAGVNLRDHAVELKRLLRERHKAFQQRKLHQAREAYKKEVEEFQRTSFHLPASAAERRALLQVVIAQQAQSGLAMTAHGRDLAELSDDDITTLLEQMGALGLVPDTERNG
jgi:hypothetical protein